MGLELSIAFLEQNDNKALQITDDTGTYSADNLTGWTTPNEEVTDIVASSDTTTASKHHLWLEVTYTGSDAVAITYTRLNLYDVNGGAFTTPSNLVFLIDPADLVDSGTAQGAADDELLDGKYDFTYYLTANTTDAIVDSYSEQILLDGKVRVKCYDQLRQIPNIYDTTELFIPIYHEQFKDILTPLLKKGMFDGMLSNVSDARADEVLDTLDIIERLTVND